MVRRRRTKRVKRQKHTGGFQPGDSVVVKQRVKDPDFGTDIGGWQGRIVKDPDADDDVVCIAWDSITLKQMPDETIIRSEEEGLSWTEMRLYPNEVALTSPRDTKNDVEKTIDLLADKHEWNYLGEEGRRIQAVLARAKSNEEWAEFEAWETYLEETLRFPFKAEVSEWQERSPLRTGERVKVLGLNGSVDLYGVLAVIQHKRKTLSFPLCDLEVLLESSPNYQPVQDYAVWFANR